MPETKKYYHNLDVDNNKVINPLLNPLTTAQRTAVGTLLGPTDQGYVCFDTTLNQQYFWDGAAWTTVTAVTTWGSITGTLTAQTDLTTYLAANYYPLSTNPANYIDLTDLSAGTGISYNNLTGVITNSAPDQTVSLGTTGTGLSVTGTYPNFTLQNTLPDKTVAFTNGTGISVTGTYPNFTITNTSPSSGGTVTGVTASSPLASSGGTAPNITIQQASGSQAGYLSSTDWTTFNSKEPAITAGTTSQYWRGDKTWQTFPTIPTVTPSALTKVDDTNVTLTLGGSPSTALLAATSLTLGWTGTLADSRIASAATWNAKQDAITLTTTGTSGAATFSSNTLNIPQYQAAGTYVTSVGATSPITSSGGTTPTISTSMATNRLIGRTTSGTGVMEEISVGTGLSLSAGTLSASVNSSITHATASGTDTYTATITGVTSYADGDVYLIRFTNGNTSSCTLNINSIGAVTLYRNNDGALIGGDIVNGAEMLCVYNSTLSGFQCIGTAPNTLLGYVTNADSVTITKGQVVYAFGGTGDRMTVKLAYNTSDATSAKTVGVVMSTSIGVNQKGLIMIQGLLDGLSILPTSTYSDGDSLYLGATAGSITNVKPYAPNHLVYVATVTTASNGSAGRMYVRIQNGYELDELHNVQAQSPSLNDTLYYDSSVSPGQWKTASIATILGYTPVNPTRSISTTSPLSGGGDLSANRTLSISQATTTTSGYLSSVDWNMFNNKVSSVSGTLPISSTGGVTPTISISQATTSTNGYLSSTDWNTFNGKANLSQAANTMLANNTGSTANMTAQAYADVQGTYTGTITWSTPANAPTTQTINIYQWSQVGKWVRLQMFGYYTNPGTSLTSVSFTLPGDIPAPDISMFTLGNNAILYTGIGMLGLSTTSVTSTLTCYMRRNAGNSANELFISAASANYRRYQLDITYRVV